MGSFGKLVLLLYRTLSKHQQLPMTIRGDIHDDLDSKNLLKQFIAGDYAAFTQIYNCHIKTLLHYGNRVTADEEQVKDSVHDLFVELWKRRNSLENILNIEFYLLKALRYKLTRSNKQAPLLKTATGNIPSDTLLNIDEIITEKESGQLTAGYLQKAIEQLPAKQREVIYLRFYKGYSNQQVAELMGINYQSVSNLLQRSIDSLKKYIPDSYRLEALPAFIFLSITFF